MPRFGRSFPMPRRGVRIAKPIGVQVTATGTAKTAATAKTTAGAALLIAFATGTAKTASTATGRAWANINPATSPLDGFIAVRVEQIRFEILDANGNYRGVLHPATAGSVTFAPKNRIARTLSGMRLDPIEAIKVTAGQSRIRPIWTFANSPLEKPVGVFLYMGGNELELAGGTWIDCAPMPDRSRQLDQKISDVIAIATGTLCTDAIATVAAGAGITAADIHVDGSVTTIGATPLTFAPGQASRLDIAGKLTDLVSYLPVYFDNTGALIGRPIPVPNDARPDISYTAGQKAKVHADTVSTNRVITQSPNVYLVRSTSPTNTAISARYDVPASAANSLANIGYEIVEVIDVAGLTNSVQALAIAAAHAKRDQATVRTVSFSAMADPRHDGWNVIDWQGERMLEVAWTLELQPGGRHTHTLVSVYT